MLTKMARKIIIALMAGIFMIALLSTVYLYNSYRQTQIYRLQPNVGRVIPFNIHGTIVYLTASEKNRLDILDWIDTLAFVVLGVLVVTDPKYEAPR
jgi:hypothetical protein